MSRQQSRTKSAIGPEACLVSFIFYVFHVLCVQVQLAQAAETAKEQVGKAKATDGDSAGKNSGKV